MKRTLFIIASVVLALLLGFVVYVIHRDNVVREREENLHTIQIELVATSTEVAIESDRSNVAPRITISPAVILPGDPVFVTITASTSVSDVHYDGKKIPIFTYEGLQRALIGIDFNEKSSTHLVSVTLTNGMTATTSVTVTPREKIVQPLGIPEKLGGNTPEAAQNVVSNLAIENASIAAITTATTSLWTDRPFRSPLATLLITDTYGYDRATVGQTIVHKGTDFRAAVGTEVRAMNGGIVRIARTYTVYGNTVIIDHGQGLTTLYMHLSELAVQEGDVVQAGELVGHSGMTGYAESPHLHISVKMGGISIDPMTFLNFFGITAPEV